MTEDEARTKWCPFARVIENGSASGAHNRVQLPTGRDVRVPVAGFCLASTCMAWRQVYTTVVVDGRGVIVPNQATWGGDYERKDIVSGGYCGLAGRPE
jgi:hypothetical protein